MVKTKEDLTGRKFGRLTVVEQADDYINPNTGVHVARWRCLCSCENNKYVLVLGSSLKNGNTTSCGCIQKEATSISHKKENVFDLESADYCIGYTLKGEPFWFDKEDIDIVKQYCWHYNSNGYVTHKDKYGVIFLHRLVIGADNSNIQVDHINHPPKPQHKIDNRKINLRFVTNQQNQMNNAPSKTNTSGKTGVSFDKSRNKWAAYIWVDKKKIHIGRYDSKQKAIAARKDAEIKYFKEYRYIETD